MKITKRVVDQLEPGERDAFVWDSQVKGFGVRCRPTGGKFYILKTRIGGRQRWLTIGRHGSPWTADNARDEAVRLAEITTLKWEHVDLEHHLLRLPDSKTGQKEIVLNDAALDILRNVPRTMDNPHVIVGGRDGQHLVNMKGPWGRIRHEAGLDGLRIHDLRHSFASVAAGMGESLPVIGKLLGHTQAQTTARYAHLQMDPLRSASNAVGASIASAMAPKPKSDRITNRVRLT